jgi:3-methylfumaryl-CoA hydratase
MEAPDIAHLRSWIGRTETATDTVTPRLANEFAATLNLPQNPEAAPLALHWCLAPPAAPTASLGPDGHPARGGFLPPVPLPRRMWAGGRLRLHQPLHIGDAITRTSRIADVTVKQGRTGTLCFVTVEHDIATPRGLAISERQDIVYRPLDSPTATPATSEPPAAEPQWTRPMTADPVLLFRYSALTFNGHRIHYDRAYATQVEHYPGLIVHGPLQATWLLHYATELAGSPPAEFAFRSRHPLFDFQTCHLTAAKTPTGLTLSIQSNSRPTMQAPAHW